MVFSHHYSELFLELLVSSQPFLVDQGRIDIYWNFHFNWNLHLDMLLDLHWPVNEDRLVDKDWFVYNDGICIDRIIHKNCFLDEFRDFNFLDYELGNPSFDLNNSRNFDYLIHDPLRSGSVPRYFYLDLNSLFDNLLPDNLLGFLLILLPELLVLRFQFILFLLEFADGLLVLLAGNFHITHMIDP
jgi:hypothetical protein